MIAFVGSLQDRARPVQPSDGDRKLCDELSSRVEQVESAQLAGSLQAVADGVRVDEQLASGALDGPTAGDERRDRVEEVVVSFGKWTVDVIDQLAARLVVTRQRPLD